jgi:heme-degrading monooxygenase HmoA
MWVRIREVSFPVTRADEVIAHVRNTSVSRNDGAGFRGFRLLIDRPNGRSLEVSYWETEVDARAGSLRSGSNETDLPGGVLERCDFYELAIDGD